MGSDLEADAHARARWVKEARRSSGREVREARRTPGRRPGEVGRRPGRRPGGGQEEAGEASREDSREESREDSREEPGGGRSVVNSSKSEGGGSFAGTAPQLSGRMGSKLGLLLKSEDLGGALVY